MYEDMQPGDLIFFSYEETDGYLDISHVGIYVGNGKMVDARGTAYGVVYRDVPPNTGAIVMIGRPIPEQASETIKRDEKGFLFSADRTGTGSGVSSRSRSVPDQGGGGERLCRMVVTGAFCTVCRSDENGRRTISDRMVWSGDRMGDSYEMQPADGKRSPFRQ